MELLHITPKNYDLAKMITVKPDQQNFVASIKDTLADAYVYKASEFRLVQCEEELIGYVLVYPFSEKGEKYVNIVRLVIDKKHQGKGHGRQLLRDTIQWIHSYYNQVSKVRISTLEENDIALSLYRSEGFEESGVEENEIALYYDLSANKARSWR